MRDQLIDAGTDWLDGVLYTHDHADQTHGIDDLRAMVCARRQRIKVWMDNATAQTLTKRFAYCFSQMRGSDYPSILEDNRITVPYPNIAIDGAGGSLSAIPFRQIHGRIDSLGSVLKMSPIPATLASSLKKAKTRCPSSMFKLSMPCAARRTRRIFISKKRSK